MSHRVCWFQADRFVRVTSARPTSIGRALLAACLLLAFPIGPAVSVAQQVELSVEDEADVASPDATDRRSDASSSQPTESLDAPTLEKDSPDSPKSSITLPTKLPDGRLLHTIGIFESHMPELIPPDYSPITIDDFREAVKRQTDQSTDDEASRLTGSVYWIKVVDDMLVSDRSVITIESELPSEVTRSLGRVNLAIEQARGDAAMSNLLPRLESESNGNLVAVFRGDKLMQSRIEFAWQLRGLPKGDGHLFRMRLPRTPQTRIVIAAPSDLSIESLDGVLRTRPGPPPDAMSSDPGLRWYELDAGGLSDVQILTHPLNVNLTVAPFVVRRSSVQYVADPAGLTWTSRSVVQSIADRPLPPLEIHGTTVTSVRVNDNETSFSVKTIDKSKQQVTLDVPYESLTPGDKSFVITLRGRTAWDRTIGWADLPMPLWVGQNILHVSAADDVLLDVVDPLQIMAWQLPAEWSQPNLSAYTAEGPPVALVMPGADNDAASPRPAWSRVRFLQRPVFSSSSTALRLDASGGALKAAARVWVTVDPSRVLPIRLRLEAGWSVDSVEFAHSGRVVEDPSSADDPRELVLWPESEDTDRSTVVIDISGSRIRTDASAMLIPPTWFVRPLDMRGDLVAAILPPSDLNWSGATAIRPGLVDPEDLSERQQIFFAGLDTNALVFQPETGRTPAVELQSPSVSFDASTRLRITRDGDEIAEELTIQITSPSQSLEELEIQTGPANGRPTFTWSISGSLDSPTTSLAASDIRDGEAEGIFRILLNDKGLGRRQLIARREYTIQGPTEIQLPSVRGAALQDSEVLLGPGLMVQKQPPSVQRVPNRDASHSKLRYDAVQQPSITFAKSDADPNVAIVWRQQVRVTASSRGTDRIEATFKVSPAVPLRIEYDPDMHVESVSRDGTIVDLLKISERPIELPPASEVETIEVVWNRSQFGSGWFRRCRMPRITVPGTVLKSEYELIAAADSFAPASIFTHTRSNAEPDGGVVLRAGATTTLFRRNIALALGWFVAILVFAASWYVAQRAPLVLAASIVVMGTILLAWWPWRLAVIGWLIVPTVAGALLAVSRAWTQPPPEKIDPPVEPDSPSKTAGEELSSDFSLGAIGRTMLSIWFLLAAAESTFAQRDAAATAAAPVSVIVPIDGEGKRPSTMIYVPRSVYSQLFPTVRTQSQEARFQWAKYFVDVDAEWTKNDSLTPATIEAEYLIRISDGDHRTNLVRLPIEFLQLRRLEIIEDLSRIVRFQADDDGQVIASFPRGSSFRVRATLLPQFSEVAPWTRLSVSIPPVASAELTLAAEQEIDAIRIGGSNGPIYTDKQLTGRVESRLGPVDKLEIDFREIGGASDLKSEPLQRRYWINANAIQTTIDCEIEPPQTIAAGETFQFLVRDSATPKLTSSSWTMRDIDVYTPGRQRITVVSLQDSPGPVSLTWTLPSPPLRSGEAVPVSIPEVIASNFGENSQAWVALHCGASLRFAKPDRINTEPLAVDQFLSKWKGHRGRIESAYVAVREISSPFLERALVEPPQVRQRHELRVMTDRLELLFDATLSPSNIHANQFRMRLPQGLNLIRVMVNGQALEGQPIVAEDASELLIGDFVGSQPVEISVVAVQALAPNQRFVPPQIQIEPAILTVDDYTISRDNATTIAQIDPRSGKKRPLPPSSEMGAGSLNQGLVPVSHWIIRSGDSDDQSQQLKTQFEVSTHSTRFDCRQLIVLNKSDVSWTMETLFAFPKNVPDFFDVELPTQWCDALEVQPADTWSQQPATDPSRQVIRIRCDAQTIRNKSLSIRGRLQDSETSRVTVPTIRVLGLGSRRVHVNVPAELDEPIFWRSKAVEVIPKLPPRWNKVTTVGPRKIYSVAPSWSIELAPLQGKETEAIAFNCDTQVFPQDTGALIMSHWDVLPGVGEYVDVRLPPSARCLGAWTAGQPVAFHSLYEKGDENADGNVVRVPLALSRLAQPVDLLVKMPLSTMKLQNFMPQLVGIRVTESWYTSYVPVTDSPALSQDEMLRKRALQLATSVVASVETLDMFAQRPREEIQIWLQQWLSRYRNIAAAVGHPPRFDQNSDDDASQAIISAVSKTDRSLSLPEQRRWQDLDARMATYVDKFLRPSSIIDEDVPGRDEAQTMMLGVANFDGFVPERITQLSAFNRPRWVQPVSHDDRGLRTLIVNVLTLLSVSGLLMCLRPIQQMAMPMVRHPAFWLGLMGVVGLLAAPLPIAVAIILIAVIVPSMSSKRTSPSS